MRHIGMMLGGKKNMKKILVGLCILLILLLPTNVATPELDLTDGDKVKSQNISNSGKPNLIITNIWYEIDPWFQFIHTIGITIKNIGDEKVEENEKINISVVVKKWFFINYRTYDITIEGGLESGQRKKSIITELYMNEGYLPGFYKFESIVNPDETIDESDYQNNDYIERALNLLYFWIGFG